MSVPAATMLKAAPPVMATPAPPAPGGEGKGKVSTAYSDCAARAEAAQALDAAPEPSGRGASTSTSSSAGADPVDDTARPSVARPASPAQSDSAAKPAPQAAAGSEGAPAPSQPPETSAPTPQAADAAAQPSEAESAAPVAATVMQLLGIDDAPAPVASDCVPVPDADTDVEAGDCPLPTLVPLAAALMPLLPPPVAKSFDPSDAIAGFGGGGKGLATAADMIQLALQQKAMTGAQLAAATADVSLPLPDFMLPAAPAAAPQVNVVPPSLLAPPPAAIAMAAPMDVAPSHPRWADDLAERVVWSAREDLGEVDIQLHPPELGPIRMHLKLEGTELAVQVSSVLPAARDAFEANLPRLRDALLQQGITLMQAQVSDQQRPQGQSGPALAASGDTESAEPVAAQTLRLRRIGLLDEYA